MTVNNILPAPVGRLSVTLARGWFLLACASLIVPGITAILLVLLRSLVLTDAASWTDLFRTALVVHVDLSAFVWFMAFAGLFWLLISGAIRTTVKYVALAAVVMGTLVMAFSPLVDATNPIMNNYIPVLDHWSFLTGMIIVGIGLVVAAVDALLPRSEINETNKTMVLAVRMTAVVTLLAILVVVITFFQLPTKLAAHPRYEILFWGGGHIAQFVYTLLLIIAWVWICSSTNLVLINSRVLLIVCWLTVLPLLFVPWIYMQATVESTQHRLWFMQLMRYGHFASIIIAIPVFLAFFKKNRPWTPSTSALLSSLLLYGSGGLIGFVIGGVNTIIPAHYHGSIVGITLALMGLAYLLMPMLGYRPISGILAISQPWIYAVGQLMHIAGLLISGLLFGAQRKTVGVVENMHQFSELATWLIRLGGLLAIVGGMLFLIVVYRSMRAKS